jgi:hypothetical protein
MERVQFITCRGKRILLVDLTHTKPEEALAVLAEAKKVIGAQPPQSILNLTDVSHLRYDVAVAQALKKLAVFNKPFVRASAVVGISGLMKIILDGVERFSDRRFELFSSREQAQEWLVQQ